MKMPNLFFSVVIPTYNRADFIQKTIESVLAQSYPHFEVIVVDDGSTDNTRDVVKAISDERVRYFYQENAERAAARNYGVKQAKGDFVTFLDSDDLLYPMHLAEALKLINQYPTHAFFHLGYEMRTPQGQLLMSNHQRKGDLNRQLITGNHLSCMGVFLKKEILIQYPFNEIRALSGSEDWELWMRLASRYEIKYSNEVTAVMINHESRSVLNIEEATLKTRIDLACQFVFADEAFQEKYGKYQSLAQAHLYLYLALHLVMAKQKTAALNYLIQVLKKHPSLLATRKVLAILKKLLLG